MGIVESLDSESDCSTSQQEQERPANQSSRKAIRTEKKQIVISHPPIEDQLLTAGKAGKPVTGTLMKAITNNGKGNNFNHTFTDIGFKNTYRKDGSLKSECINLTYNGDRLQCSGCQVWLHNEQAKKVHRRRYPIMCGTHQECFTKRDIVIHAKKFKHDRCFVPDCISKYSNEDGWGCEEIEKHVRDKHGLVPPEEKTEKEAEKKAEKKK